MSEASYLALRALAQTDPNIIGFWLGGSRGKGRATEYSDWDCALVVEDEVAEVYRARHASYGQTAGGLDCLVFTLAELEDYGTWGGPQTLDRYTFAHLSASVDKTGAVQPLIDAKACVPAEAAVTYIDSRLDHFVNQAYRAAKCRRDGDLLAARWEAAEAITPCLDALFALNAGRLRPFPKYLAWELQTFPLTRCPWAGAQLLGLIAGVLDGDHAALGALLAGAEAQFRGAGHAAVFDAWGDGLPYALAELARGP